jgi:hypothetical protein
MFEVEREQARAIHTERITASQIVSRVPALVFGMALSASSVGPATASVYDGHGTSESICMDLAAITGHTDLREFNPPVWFRKGIYVTIGSNVTSVVIRYVPFRE